MLCANQDSFPTNVLKWFVALQLILKFVYRARMQLKVVGCLTAFVYMQQSTKPTVCSIYSIYSVLCPWGVGGPRLSTDAFLCVQQNWSWFKMWGHAEENKWEHSFHSDGLLHSSTLDIPGCRVTYLWVRDDDRKVEKWNVISNYNNRVDSTKDKVRFKRN